MDKDFEPETLLGDTTKKRKLTKKAAKEMSILSLVEYIVVCTEDSSLCPSALLQANNALEELGKRYQLSPVAALLLATFINMADDHHILIRDLARHFEVKPVRIQLYWQSILELAQRGLILRGSDSDKEDFFRVPYEVVTMARDNQVYLPPSYKNISMEDFYDRLQELYQMLDERVLTLPEYNQHLDNLLNDNPQLEVTQGIKALGPENESERSMLLLTAMRLVNLHDDHIVMNDIDAIFPRTGDRRRTYRMICNDTYPLLVRGQFEHACNDGIADTTSWCLSWDARQKLVGDMADEQGKDKVGGLIDPDKIVSKQLFFRKEMQQEVDKLRKMLQPERFKQVQKRLEEHGMRKGVACIFYGAPGTGKTELLLQLAKETGRSVMLVDISQMRDKFVGETEKRIKQVFDRYRSYAQTMNLAPILVFNEADALFCKRNENAMNGVDKMENAMQNIILQEMETLDGILVATTNLASSMDAAFERRFLYKLEFQVPGPEEASHIWQAMLPELSHEEALQLAREFRFSGGQIENLARKQLIASLMNDTETSVANLREACKQETFHHKGSSRVGFAS